MNDQLHGQPNEWDQTDDGHNTIYLMDPALIPASQVERVIYELRLDIAHLNAEVLEHLSGEVDALSRRLRKVEM
jgi:hypothetical protein